MKNRKEKMMMIALGLATTTCLIVNISSMRLKIENNKLTNELKRRIHSEKRLREELHIFSQEKKIVMTEIDKLTKENKQLKEELKKKKVYFNENDITKKSNATSKELNDVLKGKKLEGLGKYYIQAEKKYNINAIALLSITAQESGWGDSDRAKRSNNLSGYAVFSPTSDGVSFSTKGESIMATAKLLNEDYLNPKGKYYQGKDLYVINETYCPNDDYHWSNNITQIGIDIKQKINNSI